MSLALGNITEEFRGKEASCLQITLKWFRKKKKRYRYKARMIKQILQNVIQLVNVGKGIEEFLVLFFQLFL